MRLARDRVLVARYKCQRTLCYVSICECSSAILQSVRQRIAMQAEFSMVSTQTPE